MTQQPPTNFPELMPLLREWKERAWRFSAAHHKAAVHYHRMHLALGIPVVLVTAVLGTSAVSSMQDKDVGSPMQIGVVFLAVCAAILAGLQTFLNYGETSERHRRAGSGWESLRWTLEGKIVTYYGDDDKTVLQDIRARMESLQKESPTIPDWIWRLAVNHVRAQENR
jgi:hypothetical protein